MAQKRVILELGTGNDLHGGDYTKAALRAVQDALHHSSLSFVRSLGLNIKQMQVDVTIGVHWNHCGTRRAGGPLDVEGYDTVDLTFTVQDPSWHGIRGSDTTNAAPHSLGTRRRSPSMRRASSRWGGKRRMLSCRYW